VDYRGFKARRGLARKEHVPRRSDIIAAIPRGSARIRGHQIERKLLAALAVHPEMARLRADARESVLACGKQLARRADYETGTSRPTREVLCRETGLSESTWKAARRRLEAWGFLGTVYPGCKRWHGTETRNDAAVYVLCLPGKRVIRDLAVSVRHRTRPPTCIRKDAREGPRAHRKAKPGQGARYAGTVPRGRPRAAGAVAELLRRGPGQTLTDGWIGHLSAPFVAAGWTAEDLAYAVDHLPSGEQHRTRVRDVRSPAAWIRWRLRHWLQPGERELLDAGHVAWRHARPQLSATQQRAAAAGRDRARREQLAGQAAAAAAARVDAGPRVAAIFEQMGWPRPPRPRRD
jgi:hypothetical protein